MKYIGALLTLVFVSPIEAMDCDKIVQRTIDSPSKRKEEALQSIAKDISQKMKNIWRTTGIKIITQDQCCRQIEEFTQIVNDCSCDVLYDLLYCAVKQPHGRFYVETLLNKRKDCCPCGRETDPFTPLRIAIASGGSLDTIELLLKKGASAFNDKAEAPSDSPCLKTPLSVAAHYDRIDVLRFLLTDTDKNEIDEQAIKLIQKKYNAINKLAKLQKSSFDKSEDVLKPIVAKKKEWNQVRSTLICSLKESFLKRQFKCL